MLYSARRDKPIEDALVVDVKNLLREYSPGAVEQAGGTQTTGCVRSSSLDTRSLVTSTPPSSRLRQWDGPGAPACAIPALSASAINRFRRSATNFGRAETSGSPPSAAATCRSRFRSTSSVSGASLKK